MLHHDSYRRLVGYVLLACLTLPWSVVIAPLPALADDPTTSPPIFIEEIAWAGSSVSTADEWIELANAGVATTSIAGWSLLGAGATRIFFPDNAEIGPGETYRIGNYAETDEKSALAVSVHVVTTTVALSNSALALSLIDASGTVTDRAGDDHAPFAGSSSLHATMIRSATSSGDLATSWIAATSSQGFKTTGDLGAPGACLICGTSATTSIAMADPLTTSTAPTSTQASVDPPVQTSSSSPIVTSPPPPPPLHYSVNEVVSNPAAGPEWVELRITESNATTTDRPLELWDKSGRFMTIPAETPFTASGHLVLSLVSARLNNGGDDVSIREMPLNGSSGVVLDLIHIPALEDGVAWAKRDDGTWSETEEFTPGGPNRFPAVVITAPVKTTSTPSASTNISSVTSTITFATTTTTSSATHGPPLTIQLNEVMSNPDGGKEWVELRIVEMSATMTDRSYELWDASGKMVTIPMGTTMASPGFLLVTLPTARLNNGGDALSLREEGGDITRDATDVPALVKGISWARTDTDEWTDTATPTPGAPNNLLSEKQQESSINTGSSNEPSDEPSMSNPSSPSAPTATAVTVNTRVRLVGTVGSVPRLLGATHAFVLLGEDGRAAIVYLPKHLHTPSFGSTVRVMGTLTATERQLELRMKTTDVWMTIVTSTPPVPRAVDYLAPALEDAWALVSATGTVKSSGATSAVVDVDAVDVTIAAPTVTGYRTKRLVAGDVIHVTGLLDPRKESPTILIRTSTDIELMSHAPESVTPPSSAASTSSHHGALPDWTPFGAAGAAVVATGGFQRIRAILKRRKLEAMTATAH